MKKKLLNLSKTFLTSCMALSFWFEYSHISFAFFGELPYPKPEDFDN